MIFSLFHLIKKYCRQKGEITWKILNYSEKTKFLKKSNNKNKNFNFFIQNRNEEDIESREMNSIQEHDRSVDNQDQRHQGSRIHIENEQRNEQNVENEQEMGNITINIEETYRNHYDQQNNRNSKSLLSIINELNKDVNYDNNENKVENNEKKVENNENTLKNRKNNDNDFNKNQNNIDLICNILNQNDIPSLNTSKKISLNFEDDAKYKNEIDSETNQNYRDVIANNSGFGN